MTRRPAIRSVLALGLISLAGAARLAAEALDDQPVETDGGRQAKSKAGLPTLWIIGDSTVKTGTRGQRGWGDELAPFFDPAKIHVVNRAIGGRSSRTFLTDGRWAAILGELRRGDVVVMQFGHNDASPINEDPPVNAATRARGVIRDNSDRTVDIVNVLTGKPETVRSYGWYLRHFVTTAREKGAAAIVCSPVPRKSWSKEGRIQRTTDSWSRWAKEAAEQSGARYLDLNEIIARAYERLGPREVEPLFADQGTHTSPAGAAFNARAVVAGLKGLAPHPLASALGPKGREVPAFVP